MEFTLSEYMQLVKGFPRNEEIVKWLNWIFKYYKIDNPLRVSAFLGRTGHECKSFTDFEEDASGAAYEGRKDLGNTSPGDGVKFKGAGATMITGRLNYQMISKAFNKDFIGNPKLLLQPEWAIKSAGYFWEVKGLNKLADKGSFKEINKIINGGYNGLEDSEQRYVRCLEWFKKKGF